ncbi:MAG: threonine/serine exporter family protein [Desulfovibrio sp.]|uniref:threonine/serine exporter family protein n=1 Tax=Desulfovibrio TaxID=872 RepID=UPI000AEE6D2C|nr:MULTISPECIES: threonine/serine exporter family protein [Desulfovibrio]MCD7984523.1 threonine/serine exporter family protein [Desulfovibrio sp.]MDY3809057.1 threonine/serine exporter family protein [Desulfovibrio porci]
MILLTAIAADGFFAAVAAMGFAVISNPPKKVLLMAGVLAAVGHMSRFALLREGVGIASASLCAALLISLCSMPCARRWHIPAEMFAFPALLPMIPGMFAYKTILATMQFLGATAMSLRQELLVDIVYNGLTAFFIMCALVIGAVLPLLAFHRESPLVRGIRKLRRRGSKEG